MREAAHAAGFGFIFRHDFHISLPRADSASFYRHIIWPRRVWLLRHIDA